jgi:MarR family transcriptional regulator, transcriptional regulator for hemolysin
MPAPPVDLSMLLNQASYALANRLTAALDELGLSVNGYCALGKAAEGDYTQRELAERAWMDKTTMVVTLDDLEARGLAERRLSPTDRRVRVIGLTGEGRKLVDKAHRAVQRVYDETLEGVPAAQRDAFIAVLEQLVADPLAAPFHMEPAARRRRRRSPAAV